MEIAIFPLLGDYFFVPIIFKAKIKIHRVRKKLFSPE
jgi:hypothetical protein